MPTTINQATFPTTEGGDYLDECRISKGLSVNERPGRDGEIAKVFPYKTINEIAFKGGGLPALALGVVTMSITGLSGGVKLFSKYEETTFAEKPCEYSADGKHYPDAS